MGNSRTVTLLGFLAVLGYCVSLAFAQVFASHLLQTVDPFSFCFYTFTLGTLAFLIYHHKHLRNLYPKLKNNLLTVFWLNITAVGSWLFLVYPLKYINPGIVSTITLGTGPIIVLLFNLIHRENKSPTSEVLVASGLFLSILFIIIQCLLGQNAVSPSPLLNRILSVIFLLIVSVSVVFGTLQNRQLVKAGFSAMDILCVRFLFLIAASGLIMLFYHHTHISIELLRSFVYPSILLAALTFVIIPMSLIQIGIQRLDPLTIFIMVPFLPILTYFLYILNTRTPMVQDTFFLIIIILALVLIGTYIRYKRAVYEK
jgi:drug/metabolite transporter (DMT)-like permease